MPTLEESLATLTVVEASSFSSTNSQSAHRLHILRSWLQIARENSYDLESNIVGKQILDIGCGQGDMIEAVAATLKSQGTKQSHVIGVDPASLDYGAPCTLGEAQSRISSGPLAEYLSFKQSTAPALVESQPAKTYTAAYFAHSLYYFPSTAVLVQTLKSLLDAGVQTLLMAEWSLVISRPAALPHLLAVLLQSIKPLPKGNIQTVRSPAAYVDIAAQAGWEIVGSRMFTPDEKLEDGKWEARLARNVTEDGESLEQETPNQGKRNEESALTATIEAHTDALDMAMRETGQDRVQCVDVWTAVFRPARAGERLDMTQ